MNMFIHTPTKLLLKIVYISSFFNEYASLGVRKLKGKFTFKNTSSDDLVKAHLLVT